MHPVRNNWIHTYRRMFRNKRCSLCIFLGASSGLYCIMSFRTQMSFRPDPHRPLRPKQPTNPHYIRKIY
jgi:hypothetical protein